MGSRWRGNSHGSESRTPVEMRFIDMFMTAIGSLIFVSILLVYLIAKFPTDAAKRIDDTSPAAGKLELFTTSLPVGRVGESYNIAVAYRGGAGRVHWTMDETTGGLPGGLNFDLGDGIIRGIPSTSGIHTFTITVEDQAGTKAVKGYQIEVAPAETHSQAFNLVVAGILAAILTWVAFNSARQAAGLNGLANRLQALYQGGATRFDGYVQGKGGHREDISIPLPTGIDDRRQRARQALTNAILATMSVAATAVYIMSVLGAK